MATLRDIKNRIKGVQSTQQITKAMKMVAAAKLRRAQEAIINARPYAKQIQNMLAHLVTDEDKATNEFLTEREVKNVAVVVVTADRGLCGAFNTNILKAVNQYLEENIYPQEITPYLICAGRKGFDFYKRSKDYEKSYSGIFTPLKYETAVEISDDLIKQYLLGRYDRVIVVYNEFKSIIQQKIVVEQFLPIPLEKQEKGTEVDYIFEPGQEEIFKYLLPKHLKAQFWRMLLESNASELGARMTAMDNATTNAKELIRVLQLTYNKARQAAITKELIEIVSGANAQKA